MLSKSVLPITFSRFYLENVSRRRARREESVNEDRVRKEKEIQRVAD